MEEGVGDLFSKAEFVRQLAQKVEEEKGCSIQGLFGSSTGFLLSSTIKATHRDFIHIVVEDTKESAEALCSDLYNIFPPEKVFYFPTTKAATSRIKTIKNLSNKVQRTITISAINSFFENKEEQADTKEEKREKLPKTERLPNKKDIIIITYPDGIKESLPQQNELEKRVFKIRKGEEISFETIKERLFEENFEREDYVAEPGQFAVRGSIIDIFSFADNIPYRLDFFGNRVENIKKFDVSTQRSIEEVKEIEIFPNIADEEEKGGGRSIFDLISEPDCVIWNNTFEDLSEYYKEKKVFDLTGKGDGEILKIKCSPQPSFNKKFNLLADDIREKNKEGYKVYICSSSKEQQERISNIFSQSEEISSKGIPAYNPLQYSLSQGFIIHDLKLCLYTDHQIFERYHRTKIRREVERSDRLTIEDINAFHIGDYIVHIDHGIGVFGGLLKTNINGKVQEAVKVNYRDGDVIFVSVQSLHKIAKYKSKDGTPPKIYKLGTGAWNNLKSRAKSRIKDIAKDLIELYAQRRQAEGFAFEPDNYMQTELEASFMYEDTPDQSAATKAVKEDMEEKCPMDRLLCGDVGFGKTEIAIRAAFKAVCSSKQVCILVPTTILALQHYNTFKERLENFPCTVDYISRFRSANEINEIIERLKRGKIDIIIGTHRLLNKKIEFKDLGLLIIDEEQKFGVAAKERLRQLKVEVDTLTLSATPIPRTLQFSLLGARDLSIINTPPPNRLPVQTEVIDFKEDIIKEAIESEIERGGQVFFVHNRVEDILTVEKMINRICPKARTVTGHGKMTADEIEEKILGFIAGEYDVLISTTIIENGIDIPNANTIIINQAQNFGLSDLHQLRGRVGRSNVKAYCYLIVPPLSSLTKDAKRRLRAIEAFSELGSGFNIAMQDLDIRGAGNLLGGEQSGFIADIGFETYQRILVEAFAEIKSEEGDKYFSINSVAAEHREGLQSSGFVADCVVETDLELFIPDEYIGQPTEKIKIYKELDTLHSEREIRMFIEELNDRYGPVPQKIYELTKVVRMRRIAIQLGFEKIVIKGNTMQLYFVRNKESMYYKTELFGKILSFISDKKSWALRDADDKLWLRIPGISSIDAASAVLTKILGIIS